MLGFVYLVSHPIFPTVSPRLGLQYEMSCLPRNAISNSLVLKGIFGLPKFTSTLLPDSYNCFLLLGDKLLTKYLMIVLFFFGLFGKLHLALALALPKD